MNARFDLAQIAQTAHELDQLLGGDDERLFHDMLLGCSDIDHVVLRIHEQIARDTEMLAGIAERKAALNERQERIKRRAEGGKALIGKVLRAGHLTKLELPEVTYSVREGKPSLKVVNPEGVPDEFQRVKTEPDKTKINEHYAEAPELPNWLVRVAALREPAVKQIIPELGKEKNGTNKKAKRVLGWSPRSNEECVVATAESLVRLGLVKS